MKIYSTMASSSRGSFKLPEYRDWAITSEQRTEAYGFRALFGRSLLPPAMFEDLKAFESWSTKLVQLDRYVRTGSDKVQPCHHHHHCAGELTPM